MSFTVSAQFATRKVSKKEQAYTDSLKQVDYKYIFPILGQKTYKAGFDIPYPVGIMTNYLWMNQGLLIDNFELGFNDSPLVPAEGLIGFGDNSNTSYSVNIRPDVWVFPFLNVYGLFGVGRSETTVNTILLPGTPAAVDFTSVVEQGITTSGVGIMGAFGVGPLWLSFDGNWTWNKPELLDKAVLVGVLGVRVGHTFVFDQHPERNIAIWGGAMRVRMASETVGQIALIDAIPTETWDKRDQIVSDYNDWYGGLGPIEKAAVDKTAIPGIMDRLGAADGSTIIKYGMDKQVLEEWNGIVGAQFQYNKRWMLRTEWGIIGDRKSALLSLNPNYAIGFVMRL
ncbi:MAG: hypothetical protein L3J29_12645 [Cyclobacteriaceae bacterium]|nr:hypothetical protein [Cyclobacteriaceae bacterium]